jgi:hypothetical protein
MNLKIQESPISSLQEYIDQCKSIMLATQKDGSNSNAISSLYNKKYLVRHVPVFISGGEKLDLNEVFIGTL